MIEKQSSNKGESEIVALILSLTLTISIVFLIFHLISIAVVDEPVKQDFNVTDTSIDVEEKEDFIIMSANVRTELESLSNTSSTDYHGRGIRIVDDRGSYLTDWKYTGFMDDLEEGDSFVQSYTWEISSAEANFWGEKTNRDVSEINNRYTILFKEDGSEYYFNDEDEKVEWANSNSFNK